MSAPIGGDSRPFTVAHGAGAQKITSYAPGPSGGPLTVINRGTERVWLSNDSMATSGRGVPLEGGTSVPWIAAGDLWAVPDDANVTDVPLVLTSAVTRWEPSPSAVAAATAAQLLATGVPIVQSSRSLATVTGRNDAGWTSGVLDVGGFQTLSVYFNPTGDASLDNFFVTISWLDGPAGSVFDQHRMTIGAHTDGQLPIVAKVAARSRYAQVAVLPLVNTPGPKSFDCRVTGYTGPCNRDTVRPFKPRSIGAAGKEQLPGLLLATPTNVSPLIAAGSSGATYVLGPCSDAIRVWYPATPGAPNGTLPCAIQALSYNEASAGLDLVQFQIATIYNNTNNDVSAEIRVPWGCVLQTFFTNNDTTAGHRPSAEFVDLSPL